MTTEAETLTAIQGIKNCQTLGELQDLLRGLPVNDLPIFQPGYIPRTADERSEVLRQLRILSAIHAKTEALILAMERGSA